MKNFVFYLGLGFLLTHEMDAMPNHEWRILPILKSLPDNTAELTFLLAHVPILALLIAFVASLNLKTRFLAQRIACGFLILHAALHFTFSGNSSYEFSSPVSTLLIFGAALCGIAFFLTLAIESKPDAA